MSLCVFVKVIRVDSDMTKKKFLSCRTFLMSSCFVKIEISLDSCATRIETWFFLTIQQCWICQLWRWHRESFHYNSTPPSSINSLYFLSTYSRTSIHVWCRRCCCVFVISCRHFAWGKHKQLTNLLRQNNELTKRKTFQQLFKFFILISLNSVFSFSSFRSMKTSLRCLLSWDGGVSSELEVLGWQMMMIMMTVKDEKEETSLIHFLCLSDSIALLSLLSLCRTIHPSILMCSISAAVSKKDYSSLETIRKNEWNSFNHDSKEHQSWD